MEIPIKYTQCFINDKWVDSVSGKKFETINPANKEVIANISEGDKADIDLAVSSARKAFEINSVWRSMDASERGKLLYKLADAMEQEIDYLSKLESLDNGKTYNDSFNIDLPLAIGCYRYYAGWADKIQGKTIPGDGKFFSYTKHEPVGVIGMITPWNFPILMQAWKIAPALACGNTLVFKPAEQTPLTALYVGHLCQKVGFPPGVINIVPGYGPTAGAGLSEHLDVDKIAFTGSTEVGHLVSIAAAKSNLKRVSLELGGKSPAIVFSDCDLDVAVNNLDVGVFLNHGQCCCASTRIYVHEDIHDKFVEKAVQKAKARIVGDAFDKMSIQGPQIDKEQLDKICALVETGKKQGAKLECGGSVGSDKGYFFQPTVFSQVTDDMDIARIEIFGPVMQILKFKTLNEVITRANDTSYGLAAAVFSTNINTVNTATDALKAGSVWVNCYDNFSNQLPFGGYKMSGHGRDKSEYALELYTEVKCVTIAVDQKNS